MGRACRPIHVLCVVAEAVLLFLIAATPIPISAVPLQIGLEGLPFVHIPLSIFNIQGSKENVMRGILQE